VIPHFFGAPTHPLFGIYAPSRAEQGRTGAVICPPVGQEGLRAHRALRLLADQLAASGVDVLRFDYFGTGDSGGDTREGRPPVWLADIRLAVDHLRELAGVRRVVLIGARLGGLLAACAEARGVSRLLLWDPVLGGDEYLRELEAHAIPGDDAEWVVQGFPIGAEMREDLAALTVGAVERVPPDVRIVLSQGPTNLAAWREQLLQRRARLDVLEVNGPAAWEEDGDFGAGAVPTNVLRQIVAWTS